VDRTDGVEHPQRPAHLGGDLAGLLCGKKGILKQKAQCIPFDKFLQHQIFPVLLRHFIHSGQIRAGIVQELAVNLRVSGKAMQNEFLSGGFVADQPYAAPSPLLHLPDLFIFFL